MTATVDLPTPPLPAATAITFLGPLSTALSLGAGRNAVLTSAITVTRLAPTALSAASMRCWSSRRQRDRVGVRRDVEADQDVVALELDDAQDPVADDVRVECRVDDLDASAVLTVVFVC